MHHADDQPTTLIGSVSRNKSFILLMIVAHVIENVLKPYVILMVARDDAKWRELYTGFQ